MNETELNEAKEYIKNKQWVFAKTYAKATPHEYVMSFKDELNKLNEEDLRFINLINKYGVIKPFFSVSFKYLEVDDMEYWVCGDLETSNSIAINRAYIKNHSNYIKK